MPASMFREDINVVGVPLTAIANATYTDARQRSSSRTSSIVGALSVLLDIDHRRSSGVRRASFKGKESSWIPTSRRSSSARLGDAATSRPMR